MLALNSKIGMALLLLPYCPSLKEDEKGDFKGTQSIANSDPDCGNFLCTVIYVLVKLNSFHPVNSRDTGHPMMKNHAPSTEEQIMWTCRTTEDDLFVDFIAIENTNCGFTL
jgi:hypothetical protein